MPRPTKNNWEKAASLVEELKPELDEWTHQGRTDEQCYGVINFLTGAGYKGIKRLQAQSEAETLKKVLEVVEGMKLAHDEDETFDAGYNQALSDLTDKLTHLAKT